MIFKIGCVNPESGFIFAYSTMWGLCGWSLENGTHFKVDVEGNGSMRPKEDDSDVFLCFINSSELVLIRGKELVVIDVTKFHSAQPDPAHLSSADHPCVVRRVSLPCRCICMDTLHSNLVVAGEEGNIYTINPSGRILSCFNLPDTKQIHALRVVHGNSYLVGTGSDLHLINPTAAIPVQSSYKLPHGYTLHHLAIDTRRNWFSAVLVSPNQLGSRLVVGSTKCLASVFEFPSSQDGVDPLYVSQTTFAETLSNGLSLVASGPTPQLLLLPLDLTTAIPRVQFNPAEDLSAVLSSQSSPKGDLIVMTGVGPSVLLVSTQSLNIVRRFSIS